MHRNNPQQIFLKDIVELTEYLDKHFPNCMNAKEIYRGIENYYRGQVKKPPKRFMKKRAEAHVADVQVRRDHRLTLEELQRHTTI